MHFPLTERVAFTQVSDLHLWHSTDICRYILNPPRRRLGLMTQQKHFLRVSEWLHMSVVSRFIFPSLIDLCRFDLEFSALMSTSNGVVRMLWGVGGWSRRGGE